MESDRRDLRVLVVDDESDARSLLCELVRSAGADVRSASTLQEARALVKSDLPDVLLLDVRLPDGEGTELLADLQSDPDVDVILVTGQATVDTAVQALRLGAHDYLTKPIDAARLRSLLAGLRRTRRLKAEVGRLKGELRRLGRFGSMVGGSPAMQQVYDLIERVAPTEATVLIVGESGTGKELVARAIHDNSSRAAGPFVPINCGAISSSLIESELFGHEKGSFTGAERRHTGCFERANGGTLFFDEVTEMSPELQVRLLRVLETSVVQRVGGQEQVPVDVRVVAATNRDPAKAVEDGQFREDLYYRLRVFPIHVPALRERRDDIEVLARHLIAELNDAGDTDKRLADDAMAALRRHSWPGNVRELRNVIHQTYIMADELIRADMLPPDLGARSVRDGALLRVEVGTPLADVERRLILATLENLQGDKKETVARLGISLKTLYNRLNAYAEEDGQVDASEG